MGSANERIQSELSQKLNVTGIGALGTSRVLESGSPTLGRIRGNSVGLITQESMTLGPVEAKKCLSVYRDGTGIFTPVLRHTKAAFFAGSDGPKGTYGTRKEGAS